MGEFEDGVPGKTGKTSKSGDAETSSRRAPASDAVAAQDVPPRPVRFPVPMPAVDDAESVDPSDAAPEPARSFHTRARRKLDASVVVDDAGGFESPLAGSVLEIHLLMRERAHLYGLHLQLVADLFADDSENEGSLDFAEVTAVKIATGLRGRVRWSV